jgi:hypothetical protein
MNLKQRMLLVVVVLGTSVLGAQTIKPFDPYAAFPKGTTYWANDRGSTIRLDNLGNGKISGRFTTAVGCGKGVARSLVGVYNGNSVGFVVEFGKDCSSTASWNGTLWVGTPNHLKTLWHLTTGGVPAWNSTSAGFDLFAQITVSVAPAELKAN